VPARLINIKYITIRAEKVASPVTALHKANHFTDGRPKMVVSGKWCKISDAVRIWCKGGTKLHETFLLHIK